MSPIKVEERIQNVLKKLKDSTVTRIVLVGEEGIGKTWTARNVFEQARKLLDPASKDLLFGFTLWVSMDRKFDKWDLYEKIASQLSLPSSADQEKEDHADHFEEQAEDKKRRLDNLKKKISEKLKEKRYLLILDDEGNQAKEEEVMFELKTVLLPVHENNIKVLITRRNTGDGRVITEGDIEDIEVKSLPEDESLKLLQEIAITKQGTHHSDSFYESKFKDIVKMSKGSPAKIIVIANLLRHIWEHDDGVWKFESTLEEVASIGEYQKATRLLSSALYMLPRTDADTDTLSAKNKNKTDDADMMDCFWQSRQFFIGVRCSVHFDELITYWMLEGCLGDVDDVDKAYERGHSVLMKLVKRGVLTKQEDNFVGMDGFLLEVDDCRHYGFRGTACLGLAYMSMEWEGLGRISKSINNGGKRQKTLSTLLIDWHRLCREVPDLLFECFQGLRVLALFNPRLKSMPSSLLKLQKLNVLVLRGCFLLEKVHNIENLNMLTVLEITGADSLKEIPKNLFEQMPNLRSLNLSSKKIKSLPESFSNQKELRWLILRGCSLLETLPSITKFTKLEILDLSGATSFKRFTDKSFESLTELQFLDLTHTQIDLLPFLKNLGKLTRFLLGGSPLSRLRFLDDLTGLEIFDLSGAKLFKEIKDSVFLNKKALRIIDLSGTKIEYFPSTEGIEKLELIDLSDNADFKRFEDTSLKHLTSLRQLLLRGCSQLKELPEMEGIARLEVLDLSGAKALEKIEHLNHDNLRHLLLHGCGKLKKLPTLDATLKLEELDLSGCEALTDIQDKSFEHLTHLAKLNLSKTKIKSLPSLSNLTNLHHLSLSECIILKELPPLKSLSNLVELDLSGANALSEVQGDHFLQYMYHLQILNFSNIPRVKLPSMSKLPNLNQLVLQGCSELDHIADLEALTNLKILDLSGTKISCLPPLKFLSYLEVLDLSGTGVKDFPYEISNLTRLRRLGLPQMDGYQVGWGRIKRLPEKLNLEECGIFKLAETPIANNNGKLSITVTSTKLFEFFKKIPGLWETHFKQFHISVCSPKHSEDSDILCERDEDMFRDIAFQTRKSPDHPGEHYRSLKIRGFDSIPTGIEDVLRYAEIVSISDNGFNKSLHDLFADNMKHCWIERCHEMENILAGKETHNRLEASLEFLWVSNMAKLTCVVQYSCEGLQSESFKNLKEIYLDCCPELVNVFSSSQMPENLKILHIKCCDKVETVFGDKMCNALDTLHLLDLPELKSIGGELPSLQTLKVKECPNLQKLENNTELVQLKCLSLDSCPKFVSVFSSSHQPAKLETLRVMCCDELVTIFEENAATELELSNLSTLHLWNLPKLKTIGRELPLPSQLKPEVRQCPGLLLSPVLTSEVSNPVDC